MGALSGQQRVDVGDVGKGVDDDVGQRFALQYLARKGCRKGYGPALASSKITQSAGDTPSAAAAVR